MHWVLIHALQNTLDQQLYVPSKGQQLWINVCSMNILSGAETSENSISMRSFGYNICVLTVETIRSIPSVGTQAHVLCLHVIVAYNRLNAGTIVKTWVGTTNVIHGYQDYVTNHKILSLSFYIHWSIFHWVN